MENDNKKQSLHGTFLKIFDCGVLICAEPGTGKSDLALSLIDRGHYFMADDCVDVSREENKLLAECPMISQHFILIHDVGLMNVDKHFPHQKPLKQYELNLIILLTSPESPQKKDEPLSPFMTHRDILGLLIPEIHLPANNHRPMPLLVEVLVKNWMLKEAGYDTVKDFLQRKSE